jgi:hypothetical protein
MADYPTPLRELESALASVMDGKDILSLVPARQELAAQLLVGQAIVAEITQVWEQLAGTREEITTVANQLAEMRDAVEKLEAPIASVADEIGFLFPPVLPTAPPTHPRWVKTIRAWVRTHSS